MNDSIIPVFLFVSIAATAIAFIYFASKNKHAILQTVEKAVQSGNQLTPELLEKLGTSFSPKVRDLRRGVVILAIGIAGMLASFFSTEMHLTGAVRAVSLFPIFVGGGFLLVWKLNRYNS